MYVVEYKEEGRALAQWAPSSAPFECDLKEAEARFEYLRQQGLARNTVDGHVPWYVAIRKVGDSQAYASTYTDAEGEGRVRRYGRDESLN